MREDTAGEEINGAKSYQADHVVFDEVRGCNDVSEEYLVLHGQIASIGKGLQVDSHL